MYLNGFNLEIYLATLLRLTLTWDVFKCYNT